MMDFATRECGYASLFPPTHHTIRRWTLMEDKMDNSITYLNLGKQWGGFFPPFRASRIYTAAELHWPPPSLGMCCVGGIPVAL